MASLHCHPPSVEPRVSQHINQIIDMIKQILDNGCAYVIDGDVYFSVDKFPDYGRLSGRKLEDNRAGERVAVDSRKQNPADFALWKVIDLYHPLALRLFLLGTHYRSPMNYSTVLLESASDRAFYIYQSLHDCEKLLLQSHGSQLKDIVAVETQDCIRRFHAAFWTSMSDDLHTNVVLAALTEPLKTMNDLLHTRKGKKQALRIETLQALEKEISSVLSILGLMPSNCSEVVGQLKSKALLRAGITEEEVLVKIEDRNSARKNKDYEKSDKIREELAVKGIALMDNPDGTTWRPSVPLEMQELLISST